MEAVGCWVFSEIKFGLKVENNVNLPAYEKKWKKHHPTKKKNKKKKQKINWND